MRWWQHHFAGMHFFWWMFWLMLIIPFFWFATAVRRKTAQRDLESPFGTFSDATPPARSQRRRRSMTSAGPAWSGA